MKPLFLALAAALATAPLAAAPARPNIVFILTDDQGPWTLGAAGDPNVVTPNLDRLRAGGALLSRCYSATPVCSPARATLLTSRYGTELGITDYLLQTPGKGPGLTGDIPTWPRILSEAGYVTGLVGKYHCGEKPEAHPTKIGYREFVGFIHGALTSVDPEVEVEGKTRTIKGWTEDILADHALDFIRRHRDQPFALSLNCWAPHVNNRQQTPDGDRTWLPVSPADWAPFADKDLVLPEPDYPGLDVPRAKRMLREYLASIHSVDRNVGRVLDLLDELGLTQNTLVIFTSDHGFNLGHHGTWHKGNGRWLLVGNRGDRPNMWETSLRVPALVRWPGVIRPGAEFRQTVSHLDWLPTLAAIAAAPLPADARIYGRNLLPLFKGENSAWPDDFYAQYTVRGGPVMRSYQTDRWKLVRYLRGEQPDEFYDRVADPDERMNVFRAEKAEVREAIRELDARLQERARFIRDPALELLAARPVLSAAR